MTVQKHYPDAPIQEAIIALRTVPVVPLNLDALRLDAEKSEYSKVENLIEAIGQFKVGPGGGSAQMHQQPTGWKYTHENGKQIFQSRVNGFTFSQLAPYDRWETLQEEAQRLWTEYRKIVKPERIDRLAVRYINRVDIPVANVDIKSYFRTSPEISPDLPQELANYFMQLRIPYPSIGGTCLMNQTIVPPALEGGVSIVLDIDLFRDENIPQEEAEIWNFFETLHVAKNQIFEACITDATRELFSRCHV